MSIRSEHAKLLKLVEEYTVEYDNLMTNGVKAAGGRASKKLMEIKKAIKPTKDALKSYRDSLKTKKTTGKGGSVNKTSTKKQSVKKTTPARRKSSAK